MTSGGVCSYGDKPFAVNRIITSSNELFVSVCQSICLSSCLSLSPSLSLSALHPTPTPSLSFSFPLSLSLALSPSLRVSDRPSMLKEAKAGEGTGPTIYELAWAKTTSKGGQTAAKGSLDALVKHFRTRSTSATPSSLLLLQLPCPRSFRVLKSSTRNLITQGLRVKAITSFCSLSLLLQHRHTQKSF